MKYSFSNSQVDSDLLLAQIDASTIIDKAVRCINWTAPNMLDVEFQGTLSEPEVVALTGIVSNHTINTTLTAIKKAIASAKDFGHQLIDEYSVTRVLRGTTDAETLEVLNQLHVLQAALMSGSLKAARLILLSMEPTSLIPQEDIDYFLHKLNTYLGNV